MKTATLALFTGAFALTLSACSGPREKAFQQTISRALKSAPGAAQPSTIVKTELAYARAAKERGQYTAGLDFAGSGARLHGRNGPVDAVEFFSALSDPDTAIDWKPRIVVMSCDGALALSTGRFTDQEGFVGNYVTTWVRQNDGEYKWVYDVAGRDDPQPPPRRQFEDGDIVVTSIDAVQGLVATCPRGDDGIPPPPALSISGEAPGAAQLSRDSTLRWRWEHQADGTKFVSAEYYYNGAWVTAFEESLASPNEE
ncbi:hypothetical protein FGU71_04160 [Erythrobacter insulae]|uniref:Nuclear transport factor 2 family protein n=1 Tax=Erythrobacter insulae TaxID=2584124 RepID=A0A547PAG3_9SPHN|nr:hypothetical protein [Erythrobacter insulae]TRD11123.1 hypothetical protein FGU71_04160 [Erythrobacter insulae]